jgi:hypothetical protein
VSIRLTIKSSYIILRCSAAWSVHSPGMMCGVVHWDRHICSGRESRTAAPSLCILLYQVLRSALGTLTQVQTQHTLLSAIQGLLYW